MSLGILRQQLRRQAILQQRVVLPAGRVVSVEEGRSRAKKQREEERDLITTSGLDGEDEDRRGAAPSTVVLEPEVSKKIVTFRQRNNKRQNLDAALASVREDRVVAKLVDTQSVRDAAHHLYHGSSGSTHEAQRQARAKRTAAPEGKKRKRHEAKK